MFLLALAGYSKREKKRLVRRLGVLCAVLQLGTAFAASRALRSTDTRQRKVAMELRCEPDTVI